MDNISDERIHLDGYSCTLCESRAGLSLKCCCPDNPDALLQVNEEHLRRRISLKHDQKLCADHVKKLKTGLLFGRTDWYECCAPFHIKSPRSPKLRAIPHSWKSFFESPSNNERYHTQKRICWDCYMLAMEVINSGLDDAFDEEDIDYQSASFDFGYMSPKRWASNISLHQPSSPADSQTGSTWSCAVQPGSSVSPQLHRNMSDAINDFNVISSRKFMTPSRSFDRLLQCHKGLQTQDSDRTNPVQSLKRDLRDEMTSSGTSGSLSLFMEESASLHTSDVTGASLPSKNVEKSQPIEKVHVPGGGNSVLIDLKGDKSPPTANTFNSSSSTLNAISKRNHNAMKKVSFSFNYAPDKFQYVSRYIRYIYVHGEPEETTKSTLDNSEPTPVPPCEEMSYCVRKNELN